ncbi:MAG: hypothetical protein EOP84_06110, partial [Verrucomicrobiaceae bacterium]
MTTRSTLDIIVYAPALLAMDGRTLAVVHGMERALPGLRLEWRVTEERRLAALPQRDVWLTEATASGRFPLLCNGDESYPVMISGVKRSASASPGGQPLLQIHAELPLDAAVIAAAADVLEGVAEAASAFWGHATPSGAGVEIARQTRDSVHKPGIPPRGLPALKLPEKIRSPEIPQRLGWLNY